MLGDMLELGDESFEEHVKVVRRTRESGVQGLFFVGEEFSKALKSLNDPAPCFKTSQELCEHLSANPVDGAVVLVKGSRGTRMEKVIAVL